MKELTKRDLFNAKNCGTKPEAYIGEAINIVGIGYYDDNVTNIETGEVESKPITVLVADNGKATTYITSPSETLRRATSDLIELCEEEKLDSIKIKLIHGTSKSGRKYLTLALA